MALWKKTFWFTDDYCEKLWGTRTPTVLDAFAGGGSIPFEAARYGLNVLASDLNPVAVVTMKAAMEYPLKFGPDLQQDIDKWVKWVGDEAQKRLAEFFPSLPGETVQNYLWAHTVVCPSCESVVPLSPNWWLSRTSNYAGKGNERKVTSDWYAVKPIPNPENKRVDFELIKGKKGKATTIIYNDNPVVRASRSRSDSTNGSRLSSEHKNTLDLSNKNETLNNSEQDARTTNTENEYDPDATSTISRSVGKCPNCGNVIEQEYLMNYARTTGLE
ncbi:DNA adenine methylase, partial [Nodularia spumigena CS-590/02]